MTMVVDSLRQVWPPFVLVVGLLLVGRVANEDGLFAAVGARIAVAPIGPRGLLVVLLALVALVAAALNLDTSVVFMTPVLLHAARRRRLDERPFLYGAVFMSNSGSLLLPGSNLTNLLVLSGERTGGLGFARQMVLPWFAACVLTIVVVVVALPLRGGSHVEDRMPPLVLETGAIAVGLAAVLVVLLPDPALPVLGVGVAACALRRLRPELNPLLPVLLFVLSVALGVATRAWAVPADLLEHAGRWSTAALAALSANVVDNLPASVLFSANGPAHRQALLLGLDLGPNLAVTGSLAAYLWFQAAKAAGAKPSIATYSLLGVVVMPVTLAAAVAALWA